MLDVSRACGIYLFHNTYRKYFSSARKGFGTSGSFVLRDLVEGTPDMCATRIACRRTRKPFCIIIPVGRARSQRKFILSMVVALS